MVTALHKADYADVELEHVLADNCAMQLVRWPKQYDVIVTDNLFGDILSDIASMLTGSLGMLPSASLGARRPGHGQAQGTLTNRCMARRPTSPARALPIPIAMIGSFAMCLRYSFGLGEAADLLDGAIADVLGAGTRTRDNRRQGREHRLHDGDGRRHRFGTWQADRVRGKICATGLRAA